MKRVLLLALTLSALDPAYPQEHRNWSIVQKGSPAASIVILGRDEPNFLLAQAGEYLQKAVRGWTGRELNGPRWLGEAASLPRGTLIVLTTLDSLRRVLPDLAQSNPVARSLGNQRRQSLGLPRLQTAHQPEPTGRRPENPGDT
jgi:hypothetical protein